MIATIVECAGRPHRRRAIADHLGCEEHDLAIGAAYMAETCRQIAARRGVTRQEMLSALLESRKTIDAVLSNKTRSGDDDRIERTRAIETLLKIGEIAEGAEGGRAIVIPTATRIIQISDSTLLISGSIPTAILRERHEEEVFHSGFIMLMKKSSIGPRTDSLDCWLGISSESGRSWFLSFERHISGRLEPKSGGYGDSLAPEVLSAGGDGKPRWRPLRDVSEAARLLVRLKGPDGLWHYGFAGINMAGGHGIVAYCSVAPDEAVRYEAAFRALNGRPSRIRVTRRGKRHIAVRASRLPSGVWAALRGLSYADVVDGRTSFVCRSEILPVIERLARSLDMTVVEESDAPS